MEYTKGEWKTENSTGFSPNVSTDTAFICAVEPKSTPDETQANAQLIAQSPRMAEWISKVAKQGFVTFPEDRKSAIKIMQAISKVEDQQVTDESILVQQDLAENTQGGS